MSSTPEVIRLATLSDVAAIELLVERAYQPLVEPIGQKPRPMLDDYADRTAAATGHREIRLYTNELMVKNLAFYPRRGYVETHRSAEAGFLRVHFRKLLPLS